MFRGRAAVVGGASIIYAATARLRQRADRACRRARFRHRCDAAQAAKRIGRRSMWRRGVTESLRSRHGARVSLPRGLIATGAEARPRGVFDAGSLQHPDASRRCRWSGEPTGAYAKQAGEVPDDTRRALGKPENAESAGNRGARARVPSIQVSGPHPSRSTPPPSVPTRPAASFSAAVPRRYECWNR